jgi:anti-sigma B factor antagonist
MTGTFSRKSRPIWSAKVCVVELAGKLDPPAVTDLEAEVDARLADGHRRFVFDCSGLVYIGSLGLRVLVGLVQKVRGDGTVVVCGLTPDIRRMFDLTRVSSLLRVYPTRADAVDAAKSR